MFSHTFLRHTIALLLCSAMTAASAQEIDNNRTDPTQPPVNDINTNVVRGEQFSSDYKVSQIYISKKTKFAMINGQKVKMGDWVEGAEVVLIKSDRIHLLINDTIKEITIMPSIKHYQ